MALEASGMASAVRVWGWNEHVIAGPAHDPAGVRSVADGTQALRRIAETGSPFIALRDPGSYTVVQRLWRRGGIRPDARWLRADTGPRPQAVLQLAAELQAYALSRVDFARERALVRETARRCRAGGSRLLFFSTAATARLTELGIRVETACRVSEVTADTVKTADGREFPARLCMWAAGIKGPALLADLGLPLNKLGQLEVNERLETADPHIVALGDCCAAPWREGRTVPARAQAAHQQADYLCKKLTARLRRAAEPTAPYVYEDHGSLVSLGQDAGVGSLMGKLAGRGLFVSGTLARLMYMSLHLMHHKAVLGISRTASLALARLLMRRTRPRVKLH